MGHEVLQIFVNPALSIINTPLLFIFKNIKYYYHSKIIRFIIKLSIIICY